MKTLKRICQELDKDFLQFKTLILIYVGSDPKQTIGDSTNALNLLTRIAVEYDSQDTIKYYGAICINTHFTLKEMLNANKELAELNPEEYYSLYKELYPDIN